ncbi:MAG: hypothetical protein KAR38_07515, partial [Calditrichia bacterium]|nr:hypothetical protein [Calditrichia bacterium]
GKGLSEMIITDLSQVKRLQLVERVRIQALMEEMALGQTGLIEEKSSAKFGKLLGAGKIIHGNVALLAGNNVRLHASYWDVINSQFPRVAALDDRLYNLFKMEKDIVFKIVDKMGIQLTPQEREKIQYIPTKNIQAFMEYCHGLEKQDQGKFIEAEQYFKNALKFDPNFKAAKQNADQSKRINNFSGSYEKYAFEAGGQFDITGARSQNLINSRLQNMGENIGSSFIPGEESRESAQEAASKIGLDKLPDPPEPPGN